MALCELLSGEGYEVLSLAGDACDHERARAFEPDLALVDDDGLTRHDAFEALAKLAPVAIHMSAKNARGGLGDCPQVIKPIAIKTLFGAIAEALACAGRSE